MSYRKILFIDRDGCLIEEPADEQVDSLEKFRLMPGVIPALGELRDAGYRFVMVSNQDGLGTDSFPEEDFRGPQELLLQILSSQGIEFDAVHIDPTLPEDNAPTRKPGIGMLLDHYPVPVIPAFIRGAYQALPRGRVWPTFSRITVDFGKPLEPRQLDRQGGGDQPQDRISQGLFEQVAALRDNRL